MYTMNDMIKEMKELRGADVRVFGQPTTLSNECDDFTIDIVDILEALSDYELVSLYDYDYDENGEEFERDILEECNDADDILNELEKWGYIKDTCDYKGDNSYNWSSPINHDFDIKQYDNMLDNGVFIVLKCHRYGDVRGNYTNEVVLKFDSDYEFFELLMDTDKYFTVEVDGVEYGCSVDCTRDWIEVWNDDNNIQLEVCAWDEEELIENIREKLNK